MMDFFERQSATRRRTRRLIALFLLVIVGTVAGAYLVTALGLHHLLPSSYGNNEYGRLVESPDSPRRIWEPLLAGGVALTTLLIIGLASLHKWSQLRPGGRAVAEMVGGRHVNPDSLDPSERRLLNIVQEMALASGIPVPNVYVLDHEPAINAFSAGFTANDAVVTVTRGALDKLSRDELGGVIAHEFSHILNGDMRLNLRITILLFGILAIGLLAKRSGTAALRTLASLEKRKKGQIETVVTGLLLWLMLPLLCLLVLLTLRVGYRFTVLIGMSYCLGGMIQAAVSRQREILADASAVQFTRNPDGIAGALKKIAADTVRPKLEIGLKGGIDGALKRLGGDALGTHLQTSQASEIAHFLFVQSSPSIFGDWGATHPPLKERILAIEPQWDGSAPLPSASMATRGNNSSGVSSPQDTAVLASRPPITAAALLASVGTVTPAHLDRAHQLLVDLPPHLAAAAHTPAEALSIVFMLLLAADPGTRTRQIDTIRARHGAPLADTIDSFTPSAASLAHELRLPLLNLAFPTLRLLSPAEISSSLDTVRLLIAADGEVTLFEFMVEKAFDRHVAAPARGDRKGVVHSHSFGALQPEISLVLSALSRAGSDSAEEIARAFAAAGARIPPLHGQLQLIPAAACTPAAIGAALDKLAQASPAIRKALLTAGADVIAADDLIAPDEADLLRAIADSLDCPIPPLLGATA